MIQLLIKKQKGVCLLSSGWVVWLRLIQRASSLHTPGPTRARLPISITVVVVLFCSGASCWQCVHHLWMLLPNSRFALPRFVWTISIPFAKEHCQIHSRKEALTILFKSCGVCEVNEKESGDKISLILSNLISSPSCKETFFIFFKFNSFGLLQCIISLSFRLGGSLAGKQSNSDHFLLDPCAWERVVLLFVDPNPSGVCGSEDMCVPVWDSGICSCSVWHLSFSFFSPQTLSVAFHLS